MLQHSNLDPNSERTLPAYNVGDLFVASVEINNSPVMEDTGIIVNRNWVATLNNKKTGYWLYTVRWSKVQWSPKHTEWELEYKINAREWQYYPCKSAR